MEPLKIESLPIKAGGLPDDYYFFQKTFDILFMLMI